MDDNLLQEFELPRMQMNDKEQALPMAFAARVFARD
jgi:hypothetical protein